MSKKETVMVFSAHTDDFVIGAGGTIKNYIKQGKKVISVVFSLGEKSHIWLKVDIIKSTRKKETFEASKILGGKVIILDLEDQKIYHDYQKHNVEKRLLTLIEKEKPTKIFTHSNEDPHPDHRVVNKITLQLYEKLKKKPDIYVYSVWNPVSFQTKYPSLYIDVSKTFSAKLKALKKFKSQKIPVAYPFVLLVYRAIKDGFKIRKRFGEHFFKIR